MKLSRRGILKGSVAAGAALALPDWTGSASAGVPPRNLIVVLNSGGWDTTFVFDPKPDATIIDAPEGTVRRFGDISLLTHAERPSVDTFFERYADIATVINGVQVRSFVHSDCVKRVMTGTASDANPDLAAIAAYEQGRDLPVPYLVLGNAALSGPLASITGRAGTTNQVSSLLNSKTPYGGPDGFRPRNDEESFVQSYLAARAERMRVTRGQRGSNAKQIEAFSTSLEREGLLRQFAKSSGGFGEQGFTPDINVQIDVGLNALEGGLCHSVMMETSNWDTHEANDQQSMLHEGLFGGLMKLMTDLEDRKLLERTVVLVLSEMGRTPKVNDALGKDHWPVTSAMVLGAGVRGNQQLGGTDDELSALGVDMATGRVASGGKQIQTSNLVAGVLSVLGVDTEAYFPGTEPLLALKS